jgi:hypothetical protein
MKKILLSLVILTTGYAAQSQVICAGISPAAIAGNYVFTWADPGGGDWACPDFNTPGVFVQDTLMMVDDGDTGNDPDYGHPEAQDACGPLVNNLTGKIAVLYRGQCEFGFKALQAQNAGAVAVIIINHTGEAVGMAGGVEGGNVTIPTVMVSETDGASIVAEMGNGDVVFFLGNKTGLFADDAGLTKHTSLISKSSGVVAALSVDNTEFNFDLGTRVYNFGNQDQTNVTVTASIDGPSGNVYLESISGLSILAGDSVDVYPGDPNEFTQFGLASYEAGTYTLTYSVDLGVADEYDADNEYVSEFVVNDNVFAIATMDDVNMWPTSNNGYRPSGNTSTFSNCINFENANGSRVGVNGLYFSGTGNDIDLSGEEMALYVYRWEDAFVDLNDAGLAFNVLNPVGVGYYYYPSDLQGETVYGALDSPVTLEDNQRFLFCVQTVNLELFLGFDTDLSYIWNESHYLQPVGPIENDGTYNAFGFGMDIVPNIGAQMSEVGIEKNSSVEGSAFPNPANDMVTISIESNGNANLVVTDVAGRTALTEAVTMTNGQASVSIADLESGVYVFNVTFENGKTSQFNVVKK